MTVDIIRTCGGSTNNLIPIGRITDRAERFFFHIINNIIHCRIVIGLQSFFNCILINCGIYDTLVIDTRVTLSRFTRTLE